MPDVLPLLMRWLHIVSIVVLIGGVFYARFVVGDMASKFKPLAYGAIGGILISGVYNLLNKPPQPTLYHVWFGIKMLLALHVFSITIVYKGKRRLLTGIVISGACIVAIAEYLRFISVQ